MKTFFLFLILFVGFFASAQKTDVINTAKDCLYMKPAEREMIFEINKLRSDPKGYLVYIQPLLVTAKQNLKQYGRGDANYAVTFTTRYENNKQTTTTDTTWNYRYEEEVKALTSLVNDLIKLQPLSVLKPDIGIYKAATSFAADQNNHHWQLMHTGTDGSHPWDRITKFSPSMVFGNENLAGGYFNASPRDIVLQLLIDAGIPTYGHRYNLLDPRWTHVACISGGWHEGMSQWIQNFGEKRK